MARQKGLKSNAATAGASGPTVGWSDDFSTDKKALYTFFSGSADWLVSGGVLAPALGAAQIRAYVTGYTPADFEIVAKLVTGASITAVKLDFYGCDYDMDTTDGLSAVVSSGDKSIYTGKNNVFNRLAGAAAAGVFVSSTKWYRFLKAGNYLALERYVAAPDGKADPEARDEVTMTANDIARFGGMRKGPIGFGFNPGSVNAATLDDLTIRGLDL